MNFTVGILIFLATLTAQAGDKIGNGGGLWVCSNKEQNIEAAELVDLYEAREEFGIPLMMGIGSFGEIFQNRKNLLKSNWPEFLNQLEPSILEVQTRQRFVEAELEVIDDSLYRIRPLPKTCAEGWRYVQFANYTPQGLVLIRKDIWEDPAVSNLNRSALLWHEVIYHWLRENHQEKDSVRTRQIVGLLYSTLSFSIVKAQIENILKVSNPSPQPEPPSPQPPPNDNLYPLWMCVAENKMTYSWHSGYAKMKTEALHTALESCQSEGAGPNCFESNVNCESIQSSSENFVCRTRNGLKERSHIGKGRNLLEAQFKSFERCQNDSHAVHCDKPLCN